MATFRTYFTDCAVCVFPQASGLNWTERLWAGSHQGFIQVGGDLGGQLLFLQCYNGFNPRSYLISWDDVGTPADVEVLGKMRTKNGFDEETCEMFVRASGALGANYEYYCCTADNRNNRIRISKELSGGAQAVLSSTFFGFIENTWIWMRFRVIGNSLKLKAWSDGSSEPVAWDIDIVDGDIGGGGWIGPGQHTPRIDDDGTDFDFFSVGTGGDIAPGPIDTYVNKLTRYNYVKPLHVDKELVPYTLEPQIWPMDF